MPYLYREKTEILLRDQETFSQVSFILLRVEGVKYKSLPGAVFMLIWSSRDFKCIRIWAFSFIVIKPRG